MLIIEIRNITEMKDVSNYEYEVWVTTRNGRKKVVAKGEVQNHMRADGWKALVQQVLDEARAIG